MAIISICGWNRPVYLLKVLNGLNHSLKYGSNNITKLLISIDKIDPCTSQQVLEAIECSNIMNAIDCDIVFQQEQLGCTGNTRYCLEQSFQNGETHTIHLEDDTYPSLDLLEYFEAVVPILDSGYFAACTFHRPCHELVAPSSHDSHKLVSKRMFEGAGGFAITRKQWERILEMGGMFGVDYVPEFAKKWECRGENWKSAVQKSDRLGFDWAFDRYFGADLPSLFPIVSRVLNIGKAGLHLSPNQWAKTHFNPNWINGDYYRHRINKTPPIGGSLRKFDTENILVDDKKYLEDRYE